MTKLPAVLEPVDENWTTALTVVAHPDDLEYGVAGAIARWTAQGKRITYCLATSGEAGIDQMRPEEAGPLREQEQHAAAEIVGVQDVWFLGHPDGMVEYGFPLRRDIARAIRRARPDIVITTNYGERHAPGLSMPNQSDHMATGRAVIDAIRDAANRWVFRSLLDEGLAPWRGVRAAFVAGSPDSRHGVDFTDTYSRGIASLKAHAAYLAGLGTSMPDPEVLLEPLAGSTGNRLGVTYAALFEVVSLGFLGVATPSGRGGGRAERV
jgi:LmbE family N-acetylglucosaminyl deacetylase